MNVTIYTRKKERKNKEKEKRKREKERKKISRIFQHVKFSKIFMFLQNLLLQSSPLLSTENKAPTILILPLLTDID